MHEVGPSGDPSGEVIGCQCSPGSAKRVPCPRFSQASAKVEVRGDAGILR
jgi:hypothetical protein